MHRSLVQKALLPATAAAALALAFGRPALADVIERSFDVAPNGEVVVRSDLGSIEVRSHDANRVDVKVERLTKLSEQMEVRFDEEGSTLRITGDLPRNMHGNHRVRFSLLVPRTFNVDLSTQGGSIRVEDLDGEVRANTAGGSLSFGRLGGSVHAHTSGGSIELRDSRGEADLSTSGGSIDVGDVGGAARVRTSGGSIRIGRVQGSVDADTSGGSIRIEEAGGQLRARTSGGNITAYISTQPTGDSELTTSGGTVRIYLADGIALNVDANGGDDGVYSDFPIDGRTEAEHSLRGKLNGGGPRLYVRATGGVEIERR